MLEVLVTLALTRRLINDQFETDVLTGAKARSATRNDRSLFAPRPHRRYASWLRLKASPVGRGAGGVARLQR
jgi:hypothetical protein